MLTGRKGLKEVLSLQQFPLQFTDEDVEQRFQCDHFRFMYPLHMLTLLITSALVLVLPGETQFLSILQPNDFFIALETLMIPLLCMALRTYLHFRQSDMQGDAAWHQTVYQLAICVYVLTMSSTVITASWIAALANNATRNQSLGDRQVIHGELSPLSWCILTLIFLSMWVAAATAIGSMVHRLLFIFPINVVGPLIAPVFATHMATQDEMVWAISVASIAFCFAHGIDYVSRISFVATAQRTIIEREMVALTCHEVRNPLNGVISHLRFAETALSSSLSVDEQREASPATEADVTHSRDTSRMAAEAVDDVQGALACAELAVSVVENMSSISRIKAGLFTPSADEFAPHDVLNQVVTIVRRQLAPSVNLRLHVEPIPTTVVGDRRMLLQVLTNLAQNAVRHTSSGFIELSCQMSALPCDDNMHMHAALEFAVRDTGSGIPPHMRDHLFERYSATGELGLGLYLVQLQLAELNAMPIKWVSPWQRDCTGTEFSFTLNLPWGAPPTSAQPVPSPSTRLPAAEPTPTGSVEALPVLPQRLRVLLADDVKVNRLLLRRSLEQHCGGKEWTIDEAVSAEEALRMCTQSSGRGDGASAYSIVFMDELFGLDAHLMRGSEAIGAIRSQEACHPSQPAMIIVHLTGNADQITGSCGADATWNKPFPKAADGSLRRAIALLLSGRRAESVSATDGVRALLRSTSGGRELM